MYFDIPIFHLIYLYMLCNLLIVPSSTRDLLGKDQKTRLELKERPDTGVFVKDLQQFVCKSVNEIQHVMTVGNQNRAVGCVCLCVCIEGPELKSGWEG